MPSIILSDNGVSSGSAGLKSTAASDGALALQTTTAGGSATTAVYVDTSQNVGLGVTPSAWSGYTAFQFGARGSLATTGSQSSFNQNAYYNGTNWIYLASSYASRYNQASGQHEWYTSSSGTAGNSITFTQAMTLDASGNLGIGTSSPLTNLDVRASGGGTLTLSTSTTIVTSGQNLGSIVFRAPNEASGSQSILAAASISAVASVANFNTTNNNTDIVFSTNETGASPTERVRITSSGNVGIGTSSPSTYTSAGALAVVSSAPSFPNGSIAVYDSQAAAADVGGVITVGGQDGAIAARAFAAFKGGKENATSGNYASYAAFATRANGGSMTERMRIDSSGNLLVGATSTSGTPRLHIKGSSTSASDLNFFFINSAGSTVLAAYNNGALYADSMKSGAGTNAVKFSTSTGQITYDTSSARYKDNIRDSVYGLNHVMQMRSAQFEYKDDGRSDVGLIAEELDPIIPELVGKNKEGQPDSVSYDRMVSVLVKAVQEQQAIITALTARIEALEA